MNSRIRAAGCDHGMLKRLVIVRADLRAEAQHEAAFGGGVEVVADLREHHWRAGEGDGNAGDEVHLRGVLGCERQRQEGVVRGLRRLNAAVAHLFELPGLGAYLPEIPANSAVNLHVPFLALCVEEAAVRGRHVNAILTALAPGLGGKAFCLPSKGSVLRPS